MRDLCADVSESSSSSSSSEEDEERDAERDRAAWARAVGWCRPAADIHLLRKPSRARPVAWWKLIGPETRADVLWRAELRVCSVYSLSSLSFAAVGLLALLCGRATTSRSAAQPDGPHVVPGRRDVPRHRPRVAPRPTGARSGSSRTTSRARRAAQRVVARRARAARGRCAVLPVAAQRAFRERAYHHTGRRVQFALLLLISATPSSEPAARRAASVGLVGPSIYNRRSYCTPMVISSSMTATSPRITARIQNVPLASFTSCACLVSDLIASVRSTSSRSSRAAPGEFRSAIVGAADDAEREIGGRARQPSSATPLARARGARRSRCAGALGAHVFGHLVQAVDPALDGAEVRILPAGGGGAPRGSEAARAKGPREYSPRNRASILSRVCAQGCGAEAWSAEFLAGYGPQLFMTSCPCSKHRVRLCVCGCHASNLLLSCPRSRTHRPVAVAAQAGELAVAASELGKPTAGPAAAAAGLPTRGRLPRAPPPPAAPPSSAEARSRTRRACCSTWRSRRRPTRRSTRRRAPLLRAHGRRAWPRASACSTCAPRSPRASSTRRRVPRGRRAARSPRRGRAGAARAR